MRKIYEVAITNRVGDDWDKEYINDLRRDMEEHRKELKTLESKDNDYFAEKQKSESELARNRWLEDLNGAVDDLRKLVEIRGEIKSHQVLNQNLKQEVLTELDYGLKKICEEIAEYKEGLGAENSLMPAEDYKKNQIQLLEGKISFLEEKIKEEIDRHTARILAFDEVMIPF